EARIAGRLAGALATDLRGGASDGAARSAVLRIRLEVDADAAAVRERIGARADALVARHRRVGALLSATAAVVGIADEAHALATAVHLAVRVACVGARIGIAAEAAAGLA